MMNVGVLMWEFGSGGLIPGFLWGLVAETKWAKWVILTLISSLGIITIFYGGQIKESYTTQFVWEEFVARLIGFLMGARAGRWSYQD